MTRTGFSVLMCLVSAVLLGANPEKIAELKAGKTTTAYASWWGFDPEDSYEILQAAINSGAKKLVIDHTGKDWVTGKTLLLASNQEIVIADKVVVKAKRGAFKGLGDSLFKAPGSKHVIVRGEGSATLRMNRADYMDPKQYRLGEWRHIFYLQGVSDMTIRDLNLADSGGDGIYVGAGVQPYCRNLRIENVTADGGNRLGIAIISAENLIIRNCRFLRTVGASPAGGLDFEPNRPVERLVNCIVENCLFEDNRGAGISVSPNHLNKNSVPVSITFKNCRSIGNGLGLFLYPSRQSKEYPAKGVVEFINCEFLNNTNLFQDPVVDSVRFLFKNCTFSAGKQNGTILHTVCKHADGRKIGGLYFENCTVLCDPAKNAPVDLVYQGTGSVSDEIKGSLLIKNGAQAKPFDFGSFLKERQAYFDKINSLKPAASVDLNTLRRIKEIRPRDPSNNGATLRGSFTYLQYAEKGQTVTVNARCVSGGYPQNLDFQLNAPDGKLIKKYSIAPDGKENPITFTAPQTGYYSFTGVTVQRVDFSSAFPGGAYRIKDGFQVLLPISGKLYFEVPAGVAEFQIGISADQKASVALLNAEGKEVQSDDAVNSMTLFHGSRKDASKSEIWGLHIKKAVWQVSLKLYEPLIPLVSSNPDTLPLKGNPETVRKAFLPAVKTSAANTLLLNPGFEMIRNGLPLYWQISSGKRKAAISGKNPAEGDSCLHLETSEYMTLMSSSYVKVAPGKKIRLSIQARGKGEFRFEASNYYEKNKRWVRPNTLSPVYKIDSQDWKKFSFESMVSKEDFGADGKIGWIRLILGVFPNAGMDFDQCSLELVK